MMNTVLHRERNIVFSRQALEREKIPHLITPAYSSRGISNLEFDGYITFIEQILRTILPQDLIFALSMNRDPEYVDNKIHALSDSLPLIVWNDPERAPCTLCVSLLCHSDFTHGVGRYLCDILSRWLVPGKFLNISSVRSLNFHFISRDKESLFFQQTLLDIENDHQLALAKSNQENVEKEARLSILAVRHARNIISVKHLTPEQKKTMIEENIASVIYPNSLKNREFNKEGALNSSQALPASLRKHPKEQGNALLGGEQAHLNKLGDGDGLEGSGCTTPLKTDSSGCLGIARPERNLDNNVFEQMQNLWLHVSAEDKINQLQEYFSPYIKRRPKIFDRDIFHEIKNSILLFNEKFTGMRDLRHVSRLISYQYLFRKTLMRDCMDAPGERHLSLKLIRVRLSNRKNQHVIGIIGAMNVLSENEIFEERHILEAISHCLPSVRRVENSVVLDRRSHDPIRLFYLEIEKKDGTVVTAHEMKELKKNLPHELKESAESFMHPVLMPRNEEEIMRNIYLLSQQLKYLNDLPK